MSGYQSNLKSSNYKLILRSDHKDLQFFCLEVTMPSITIGTMEIPYQSMTRKIPGNSLTYDNLTCTIIIDENLKTIEDILSTLRMTHDPETNEYTIDPITFDGFLFLTTNKNNPQYKIWFRDMWLETFSELQFMSTTTDENPITTTCGFRFNYYTFERI